MAKIEIDVDGLNEAFRKAYPQKKQELEEKAAGPREAMGLAGIQIDKVVDTFCEAWPDSRRFIKLAMRGFGLFFPAHVAMANAVITAIDEKLYPIICKPE